MEPMNHLKRAEIWAKSKKSELDMNDDAIVTGHVVIQWFMNDDAIIIWYVAMHWVKMITSLPNMSTWLCNLKPDCATQWAILGETLSHLKSEQQEEEEEEHQTVKTKKAPPPGGA